MTRHVGDRGFLFGSTQMIELEHPRWKSLPAIGTGLPFLSFQDRLSDHLSPGGSRPLGLLDVLLLIRLIMLLAVSRLAGDTIGLPAVCSLCFESCQRLHDFTARTSPFIHPL
jgi:hypothetical protein